MAAAKHFIAQGSGGKIINIASVAVPGGSACVVYRIQKRGDGVTRLLANEWAKQHQRQRHRPGVYGDQQHQQLRADEQRSSEILDRILPGAGGYRPI